MIVKTRWQFSWYRTTILPLCQRAASEIPLSHSESPLCKEIVELVCAMVHCSAQNGELWTKMHQSMSTVRFSAVLLYTIWCRDGMVVHTRQSLVRFGAKPGALWIGRSAKTAPFGAFLCCILLLYINYSAKMMHSEMHCNSNENHLPCL